METKIVTVQDAALGENILVEAGEILRKGGLVAFPTETVYGLGGDALNPESSKKIYAAKGRPSDNPLIVHICCMEDLQKIAVEIPKEAYALAEAFWPGPMTLVLKKSPLVPYETTGGLDTVAVRMPNHPVALALIEKSGGFIAAPSANTSGRPSPTSAKYVEEDLYGRIEMIIDGGFVGIGLESTIVDVTVTPPQILRPGYVTERMLQQVCGQVAWDEAIVHVESGKAPRAPGMKYRHYAPKGELVVVRGENKRVVDYINQCTDAAESAGERTGVIATRENASIYHAKVVHVAGAAGDEEEIARNLYDILRRFDEEGVTRIYSEEFSSDGLGQAIMNRLLKAAGQRIVDLSEKSS